MHLFQPSPAAAIMFLAATVLLADSIYDVVPPLYVGCIWLICSMLVYVSDIQINHKRALKNANKR